MEADSGGGNLPPMREGHNSCDEAGSARAGPPPGFERTEGSRRAAERGRQPP